MAGIALTGLASGLDTESIISQLIATEKVPRTAMTYRQAATQARSDALKDVAARLSSLKLAATALRSAGTWGDVQKIESADPSKVAVRTLAGAAPGGHTVAVTSLARAAQSTFDYTPPLLDGALVVNGQAIALSAGATLDDAVSAINSNDSAGVFAVNVGGKLTLSAKTTGAASAATAVGTMVANGTTLGGADASFSVDGTAYTRSSNVVSDAIAGVELTLKGPTTGTSLSVSAPGPDPDAVVNAAKAFVTAYNSVVDGIRQQTTEKPVKGPTSTTAARQGSLFNDNGLNGILTSLRGAISASVPGLAATMDQLSEIGISTGASTGAGALNQDAIAGKLTFDAGAFRAKLDSDPTAVKKLLGAAPGVDGFAQRMETLIDPLTQAGGTFDSRVGSVTSQLSSIADGLARFDDRIASHETLLRKQFAALEVALQKNQDTLARVQKQFA